MAIAHKKYIPNTHHFTLQCVVCSQGSQRSELLKAAHDGRDCGTPEGLVLFP